MRFQTIVAPTITELFERQIQGMILSGQVEPGEKLPTEAELAEIRRRFIGAERQKGGEA